MAKQTEQQPIEVLPTVAQIEKTNVFVPETGQYQTHYTWEGDYSGIVAVSSGRMQSFIEEMPYRFEIIGTNELADVTYLRLI